MDISIHTPHIDADNDDIQGQVQRALDRFGSKLTRVDLYLKDTNGAKGGVDKHCSVEARPRGLDPVAVDDEAETIHDAVQGALKKMQRHLDTKFGKLDDSQRG